jgi:hypothetical protein
MSKTPDPLRRRGSMATNVSPLYLHAIVLIQKKFRAKLAARRARIEVCFISLVS